MSVFGRAAREPDRQEYLGLSHILCVSKIGLWLRVEGRVQGVGFRAHVRDLAEGLQLDGEVWNTRDRAVEMNVYGDSALVEDFALTVRNGPGHVERLVSQPIPGDAPQPGFHVGATR